MLFLHDLWYLFPKGLRLLRPFPFRRILPVALSLCLRGKRRRLCCFSTHILIVAETAVISLCALSFCLPLTTLSLLPFNADKFPFTSFDQNSCFNSLVSSLVSGSDLLIHASLHHGLQLLIGRLGEMLLSFLFVSCLPTRF